MNLRHYKYVLCLAAFVLSMAIAKAQCPITQSNLSFSPNKAKYCLGENITITLNTSNTILGLNWNFSGNAATTNTSAINIFNIIKINGSGLLTVNGMTKNGSMNCPVNLSILIQIDPPMTINAGPDVFIGGGLSQASIGGPGSAVVVSGGTAPFTYAWNPATGLSASNISNPVASPAATTNYTLTVTDTYACVGRDNVTVYNVSSVTNNMYYAVLKKKLDAGYYNSINSGGGSNLFYFKFEEEYYNPGANLTYRIYNDAGALVNTTPAMLETIGDNRFALNVASLTVSSYYKIYVYNHKNEVWEGRLKIN